MGGVRELNRMEASLLVVSTLAFFCSTVISDCRFTKTCEQSWGRVSVFTLGNNFTVVLSSDSVAASRCLCSCFFHLTVNALIFIGLIWFQDICCVWLPVQTVWLHAGDSKHAAKQLGKLTFLPFLFFPSTPTQGRNNFLYCMAAKNLSCWKSRM